LPYFARMKIDQFVLEYATPRAGPIELLSQLPPGASVGFGAVNPRTTDIEDPRAIAERAGRLAALLGPGRVWLNPDCGFGTFAERPVASEQTARHKLEALVAAAALLR
jgi:5-methyltetrahydropteroyltriglutamate--homocysteine methyltransferase